VTFEKMKAEAAGKTANAEAVEKLGLAEATVTLEKMKAAATGTEASAEATEKMGLAEANVIAQKGSASAVGIDAKMKAEAAGLAEKAKSMKALDEAGRGHEEFRLNLDKEKTVELEEIRVQRDIAEAQARVMAEAFKSADIDIIGGDGQFFDKLMNAATLGKSADQFMGNSETASAVLKEYIDGERSLPADLQSVLSRPRLSSGDVQNLTLSAFLGRLALDAEGEDKSKLDKLVEAAKQMGLDKKIV